MTILASDGLPDIQGGWLLQFLTVATLGLIIFNQAKTAFGKKETVAQPLMVEQLKSMATQEEVEKMENEIKNQCVVQRQTSREALGRIHSRIDKLSDKTSVLVGLVEGIKKNQEILIEGQLKNQ